ncbi:insulinase family protein [Sphingomonas sp.]|jgi:hypothetical protein|uniref:insulinase family protein n=1 Tax=Sphingomonas sp. TaxID=28214 RepID=UPI002E1034E4|nr:insulinase family protein [Sphingomonas sp.]
MAAPGFAQEDARPDPSPAVQEAPAMTVGRLANGLRYAILKRKSAEPGAGVLMRNEGGFIAERRPGERGLSHLIEHLVFLSPTRAAPETYRRFVAVGLPLTFGAPSAATNSWRETNYFLSTRRTDPGDLDILLALFREAATELTFREDAVDAGRAEVMKEMAEKRAGNALFASYIAAIAPGSPTDVIDAQNSDDVPTASIATIRDLYHRLYHPAAMVVVVVGDVDVAATQAAIAARFGSWAARDSASAPVGHPQFVRDRIRPVSVAATPGGRRAALVTVVMPTPRPADTVAAQARAMLLDQMAITAITSRLRTAQPNSPPGKVGALIETGEQGHRQLMLWDHYDAGQWSPAVQHLRRTSCDLVRSGFSEAEWAAARDTLTGELERRAAAMATVPNVDIAKDLSRAVADGRALILPDALLAHARAVLPRIDARSGSAWWRAEWRAGREHFRVEEPDFTDTAAAERDVRDAVNGSATHAQCRLRE